MVLLAGYLCDITTIANMERKSFLLRIDPALWGYLEAWAQDELRSVNGQMEYLLRQAIQNRKETSGRDNLPPREASHPES